MMQKFESLIIKAMNKIEKTKSSKIYYIVISLIIIGFICLQLSFRIMYLYTTLSRFFVILAYLLPVIGIFIFLMFMSKDIFKE